MKEAEIAYKLKKLLSAEPILLQSIEMPRVPDYFYQHANGNGWIELKIGRVTTDRISVPFRPGQYAWIQNCLDCGGHVTLVLFRQNTIFFIHDRDIDWEYRIDELSGKSWYFWYDLTTDAVLRGLQIT